MAGKFSTLPNQLSLVRALLIPVLWVLALLQLSTSFAIVYIIAGVTDFLDGKIARMQKQTSAFGSWLDSLADNILSISLPFWVWLLLPAFVREQLVIILILFGVLVLNFVLGFVKYKQMIGYHLYSLKAAALMLYVFPAHALLWSPNLVLFYITASVIAIGLLEGIVMTLTHKKMEAEKVSILTRE